MVLSNPPDTSGHPHKLGYVALHPPYVAIMGDSFLEITLWDPEKTHYPMKIRKGVQKLSEAVFCEAIFLHLAQAG